MLPVRSSIILQARASVLVMHDAVPHCSGRSGGSRIQDCMVGIRQTTAREIAVLARSLVGLRGGLAVVAVADIMRRTRAPYRYAVRKVGKNEKTFVPDKFARAILNNDQLNFWDEIKRVRLYKSGVSNVTDVDSIAKLVADCIVSWLIHVRVALYMCSV